MDWVTRDLESFSYYLSFDDLIKDIKENEVVYSPGMVPLPLYLDEGGNVRDTRRYKPNEETYLSFLVLKASLIVSLIGKFLEGPKSSYLSENIIEGLISTAEYLRNKDVFVSFIHRGIEGFVGPENLGRGYKVLEDFRSMVRSSPLAERAVKELYSYSSLLYRGSDHFVYLSVPGANRMFGLFESGKVVYEVNTRAKSYGYLVSSLLPESYWKSFSLIEEEILESPVFEFKFSPVRRNDYLFVPVITELNEKEGRPSGTLVSAIPAVKVEVDPDKSLLYQVHVLSDVIPISKKRGSELGSKVWGMSIKLEGSREGPRGKVVELKKGHEIVLKLKSAHDIDTIYFGFPSIRVLIEAEEDHVKKEVIKNDPTSISSYPKISDKPSYPLLSPEEKRRIELEIYEKAVRVFRQKHIDRRSGLPYRDIAIKLLLRFFLYEYYRLNLSFSNSGEWRDKYLEYRPGSVLELDYLIEKIASGYGIDQFLFYTATAPCFESGGEKVEIFPYSHPSISEVSRNIKEFLDREDLYLTKEMKTSLLAASVSFYPLPSLDDIYGFLGIKDERGSVVRLISNSLKKSLNREFIEKSSELGYRIFIGRQEGRKTVLLYESDGEFFLSSEWEDSHRYEGEPIYPTNWIEGMSISIGPIAVELRNFDYKHS